MCTPTMTKLASAGRGVVEHSPLVKWATSGGVPVGETHIEIDLPFRVLVLQLLDEEVGIEGVESDRATRVQPDVAGRHEPPHRPDRLVCGHETQEHPRNGIKGYRDSGE